MDICACFKASPLAGSTYFPEGVNPASGSANPHANGPVVFLIGRNYNITAWYMTSRNNADDNFEIFHLWINNADSGHAMQIPNGSNSANATGLTWSLTAGDAIAIQFDAGADVSGTSYSITLHLEPR